MIFGSFNSSSIRRSVYCILVHEGKVNVLIAKVSSRCFHSLRSKRLRNIGRVVLGNAGGARSTREEKGRKPPRA